MTITTKFSLGEKVYCRNTIQKKIAYDSCPTCSGTGSVELKNNTTLTCPTCKGKKSLFATLSLFEASNVPSTIHEITTCSHLQHNTLTPQLRQDRIIYKTDTSGIVYLESELFSEASACAASVASENETVLAEFNAEHCTDIRL